MTSTEPEPPAPSVRSLLMLSIPAIAIGVISALTLWAVDEVADIIQDDVWTALPRALGIAPSSGCGSSPS